MTNEPLVEIEDLTLTFNTPGGLARIVDGVDLRLEAGRMSGLVGESGCGKSVTSKAILGLLPRAAVASRGGRVLYRGEDLTEFSESRMRSDIRGREIAMVFQDPMTALNPVLRIGTQLTMPMRRHLKLSRQAAQAKAIDLLVQVGIPNPKRSLRSYPHQFSGGQRQRIVIAIALSCDPKVLIADEPTTALDVTVQAQIFDLFDQLQQDRGLAILLVSHDLGLIGERCDDVSVMYGGKIVEVAGAVDLLRNPIHPYSALLERARPQLENPPHTILETIPGRPPDLLEEIVGCAFRSRCPVELEKCGHDRPVLLPRAERRMVSCWREDFDGTVLAEIQSPPMNEQEEVVRTP